MEPAFSIVMTSFNYAAYIGAAIESVLGQTCQDWELLIVDDQSTDGSWEIIQNFRDPRIRSYLQPVNSGACNAYNLALSKARGKYVASLDSDDLFMPRKLERQLEFLEQHPEVGICGVFVSEIDRVGYVLSGPTPYADWFNVTLNFNDPAHWIWTNHLCHSGVVVRADLHRALGPFNPNLVMTPDWEFWLRALTSGAGFAVIAEPLVAYRNHGGNITQNAGVDARTSLEHATTASQLLIPWLAQAGRSDLLLALIDGVVTRVAEHPGVETKVAHALAGGAGAGPAIAAALRLLSDQRAALRTAEQWRQQLVAGQEALQAQISAHVQLEAERRECEARNEIERNEKSALERASWGRLLVETRGLQTAAESIPFQRDGGAFRGIMRSLRAALSQPATGLRGAVNRAVLTDLHGVSFAARDHKTLLVLHELSRTGAPRVVLYLAQAIRQITGVTPLIWSPVDGDIRSEFEADGFPVIVDPSIMKHQSVDAPLRRAVAGFDSVIVTSLAAYPFVRYSGDAANRLKWWIHEDRAGFDYVTTELAPDLALLFERCEAVWLGSPLCFGPASPYSPREKLFLLLYGCKDTARPAVPNAGGKTVISIVGSLEPRKGQDIFVEAIELLSPAQRDGALFRIIGSATEWFAGFEASIRSRATTIPQIEFIPNVSSDRLDALYAETSVVVSASRSDPMPISVTQGLMFGKACVCSSVIGHAALLRDGQDGLLFSSTKASDLAEKMASLISNPDEVARIGAAGRMVFDAHFRESQFVANVDFLLRLQKG